MKAILACSPACYLIGALAIARRSRASSSTPWLVKARSPLSLEERWDRGESRETEWAAAQISAMSRASALSVSPLLRPDTALPRGKLTESYASASPLASRLAISAIQARIQRDCCPLISVICRPRSASSHTGSVPPNPIDQDRFARDVRAISKSLFAHPRPAATGRIHQHTPLRRIGFAVTRNQARRVRGPVWIMKCAAFTCKYARARRPACRWRDNTHWAKCGSVAGGFPSLRIAQRWPLALADEVRGARAPAAALGCCPHARVHPVH